MIKLICSDLDGTLIRYGDKGVRPELYGLVRRLSQKGILFCPASGRQFTSQAAQFAPVKEHCIFICENGAVVFGKNGALLGKTVMPRSAAEEIAEDFWNRSDGRGEVMLSGENTAYLMSRGLGMEDRIRFIGNNYKLIRSPAEIPEDITKVSVFIGTGCAPYAERFVSRWSGMNAAVAGPFWIDTMAADKGTGVRTICKALDIRPEEVMAFGDNWNDVPMLDAVGMPYIMSSACGELLERYPNHASSPEEVIARFLDETER